MAEKISYRQMIPLGLTSFITPFMSSSLNLSIPSISAGFSAGAVSVGWVITIFLLFSTAFSVPFGRIADLYGKKKFLLSGASVFTAASLFCGMAPNLPVLLIGRAVQGFGASMIFATATALISAIFPPSVRGRMMGISVTLTYLGLSLGPVLGGQLNHYFGWRSIFFFSTGAGMLACLAIVLILKEPEHRRPDSISLDIPGILMYLAAISMVLYGLTELTSHSFAWLILAGGILVSFLFVRHELKAPSPLLNLSLFTGNRPFALSNLAALLNYGASYSVSYVLSIYLQNVRGFTSRSAGLLLITAPAVQALFSGFAGRLSDRHSPYKLASSGMALSGLGICMLIFVKESTAMPYILFALAIIGLGFAFFSSPNTNAIMSSVDKTQFGIASSVTSTSRTLGQSSSTAMITAVFGAVIGNITFAQAAGQSIIRAMHIIFILCTLLSVLGVYCSSRRS